MAKKSLTKEEIQKKYQDFILSEAKTPETVRIFTEYIKTTDANFFEHFGSLERVESSIWEDYYKATFATLAKDADFNEMTSHEKHLSFLYTLLEIIKEDRAYIQYRLLHFKAGGLLPKFLIKANQVLQNEEVNWANIPKFIPEKGHKIAQEGYKQLLWKHSLTTIYFWVKDDSDGREDTDAFIEKSTRTVYDLGEFPALNSVLDFSKFLFQKSGFSKSNT